MDYTERGSSPIDWCEHNYLWNPYIAEFFNTISNGVFFILPPVSIYLFRDYARHVTYGIHAIFLMLIVVGAGSVYFHATLTMAGQLMDELSILWVIMTGIAVLFPENYLPLYFHKNKNHWYLILFSMTGFITYLCFLKPYLNAYFLMLFGVPVLGMLYVTVKSCSSKRVVRLGKRTSIISALTISLWIADRIMCDLWLHLNIPYLHSVFHILVFFSAYYCIVVFAYFTADYRVPHLKPSIQMWPATATGETSKHRGIALTEWLQLPYVCLKRVSKQHHYEDEDAANASFLPRSNPSSCKSA